MELEDLLIQIDKNLYNADIIAYLDGKNIHKMRKFVRENDIKKELAVAFSLSYKDFTDEDFEGYKLLTENIEQYQRKYGFKTLIFNISLPEDKWKNFAKKIRRWDWVYGMYFPPSCFRNYDHETLKFSRFGIVVEYDSGKRRRISEHEALHCDFQRYSVNLTKTYNVRQIEIDYGKLFEVSIFNEMIALMFTNDKIKYKRYLTDYYFEYLFEYHRVDGAKLDKCFTNLYLALNMVYWLKERVKPKVLAPLLFSMVPPYDELLKYGGIFKRIVSVAKVCENNKNLKTIEHVLKVKGYCKKF